MDKKSKEIIKDLANDVKIEFMMLNKNKCLPAAGLQKIGELSATSGGTGIWQGIAVLILALLFPNKTLMPDMAGYNASMSINW